MGTTVRMLFEDTAYGLINGYLVGTYCLLTTGG